MIKKLFLFSLYIYIILVNYLTFCNAKISDKRLCADPECSSILSYATTLLQYFPSEECMIQFSPNVKVNVMSKGAGTRKDLWEIEYNGKRGYAPSHLLKETRILKKSSELVHVVPTKCENGTKIEQAVVEQPKVEIPIMPASAVEPFEMIDGTKIFNDDTVNDTEEVGQAGSVVETPNLSSAPPLEDKQNELPSPTLDAPEDDDPDGDVDLFVEEEVNDSEDEEFEKTVDSNRVGDVPPSDLESKIASVETTTDSITSENVSSEVENSIKTNENESLPGEPEVVKVEDAPSLQPEITPPIPEVPSKIEEQMLEPPQTMVVTENPNEIPRPILEDEIVLDATTPTPFLEPTINMPQETVASILETSSKSEEENFINSQKITSETPQVPSIVENNAKIVVEEPASIKEELEIELSESVEPEKPSEPNPIQHKHSEEQQIASENSVNYQPPLPPRFDETPPDIKEQPIVKESLVAQPPTSQGFYETPENPSPGFNAAPPAIKEQQIMEKIPAEQPSTPQELFGTAEKPSESNTIEIVEEKPLVEDQAIVNEIPVAQPLVPPQGFDETLEKPSHSNSIGSEHNEERPTGSELPEIYPPPPSPSGFDETPSVIKETESVPINIDNKIEELGQKLVEEDGPPATESVDDQLVNDIPLKNSPSSPDIPPPVMETPEIALPQENPQSTNRNTKLTDELEPESPGLFARIYAKMFGTGSDSTVAEDQKNIPLDEELNRILYPENFRSPEESSQEAVQEDTNPPQTEVVEEYCENLTPNSCPKSAPSSYTPAKHPILSHFHSAHTDGPENCTSSKGIDYEEYVKVFLDGIIKMKDFIIYLTITAATVLSFMFGYYCINKGRKESPLINNLNVLERNLMVSKKENALLHGELEDTRQKLASIEDNSFGSNEMVMALKTQLEESENHKIDYQHQVFALEKELESATEAGLELNRMVAELLNNQSGSESIISSVEELQKQLNEQQETIFSINATLAEKSRENSELQVFLNEQKKQFDDDFRVLQSLNEHLTETNTELNKKINEMTETLEVTVNEALKSKSDEIVKLTKDLGNLKKRYEDSQRKVAKAESRCQILDEYLKNAKNDATDTKEVYDLVQLKSDALAANKEKEQFKERLEGETDARKLLEDHLKVVSDEVSNLKKEYNVAEKEKVEAQTRLEVLSAYFKEKETQLQKELSIKDAMWLQQKGEKTSTIERVQSMQDEIQNLKSQNDALRAEIEAQAAAHKTQIAMLDSRAHEEWLNAKQAKRKLEEVRSEAAGLRRKLTVFGESGVDATGGVVVNGIDVNLNAPSPILMDNNPGAPMLGVLPPPPFMPPPFMGPPPPFMPPPFMPGEMRPPPLGRLMSPPPNRYSPSEDRDRYSPNRSPGRYSPDARYNYTDVPSPYETETDFSPPPSPPPRHGGYRDNRGYKAYSPPPQQSDNRNKKSKGGLSSGSTDSLPRRRGGGGGDNAGPNHQNGSNKV